MLAKVVLVTIRRARLKQIHIGIHDCRGQSLLNGIFHHFMLNLKKVCSHFLHRHLLMAHLTMVTLVVHRRRQGTQPPALLGRARGQRSLIRIHFLHLIAGPYLIIIRRLRLKIELPVGGHRVHGGRVEVVVAILIVIREGRLEGCVSKLEALRRGW